MFRTFSSSVALYALVALGFVAGCKKSEDMTPVQPGETITYKDDARKFSFKAPKAWIAESQPGVRTTYFSTSNSKSRFQTFTDGDLGARIEVGVDSGKNAQQEAEQFRQSLEGVTFTAPEQTTLGGEPALKVTYSQGKEADAFTGYRIFADHDSLVTYFDAATFGTNRMAKYQPIFDLAEKSVSLAHIIRISASGKMDSASEAALNEDIKPSETMSTYSGNGFTIDYPSNFNIRASTRGVLIKGERNDATLQVDQLDNPSGDLTKFANENSQKVYHGAAVQSAKVGGQDARLINYSFSSAAGSRAYFVAKGKTVFRITINWPVAQEASYKPALEKSAISLKLK